MVLVPRRRAAGRYQALDAVPQAVQPRLQVLDTGFQPAAGLCWLLLRRLHVQAGAAERAGEAAGAALLQPGHQAGGVHGVGARQLLARLQRGRRAAGTREDAALNT